MPSTLQKWEFATLAPLDRTTHENTIRIPNTNGEPNFTEIIVDTKIKDIIGTPLAVGYTNLKLKTYYDNSGGSLNINMSCIVSGSNVNIFSGDLSMLPYSNGMQGRMKYQFSGLSSLPTGYFTGKGRHQILGYDASGTLTVIDEQFFNIQYERYGSGRIHTFPDRLYYNHDIGANFPATKTLTVWNPGNGTWILVGNNKFVLSSASPNVTIGVDGSGNPTATGTGPQDVEVGLGSYFSGVNTIGDVAELFSINYPSNSTGSSINVYVHITNDIIPLFFFGVKNFSEPVLQTVILNGSNAYSVANPAWLTVTSSFAAGKITVNIKPIPTTGMALGIHQGNVVVTYIISGNTFTKTISVTYDLGNYIQSPYNVGGNAFTLDTKFFDLNSLNTDTYFQITANIKAYDFYTNALKEYSINQKIILFKGESKFNLGQNIHRLMNRSSQNIVSIPQYQKAKLTLTCEEKFISDDTVHNTATSPEISFVAGLSFGVSTLAILDINSKPSRVTKKSFTYLNILIPSANYELRVLKNSVQIDTIPLTYVPETILTVRASFENYKKGDVIEYYLIATGTTLNVFTRKKVFILFPECHYSNSIIWENEFLLQSVIECTGIHEIKSEFEFISQKVYKDLVEKLEHLSVEKEVKLTINTGWLMKSDIVSIESLMRSQRVWIAVGIQSIEIRPMSKSMINSSTDRELIEFTLEFQINRKYNEETYSL